MTGFVTVAVVGSDSLPLNQEIMSEIQNDLSEMALASLTVRVIPPVITTVDVTCTVRRANGYLEAAAIQEITDALTEWLNPTSWDWEPAATSNALIGKLYEVPSVAAVLNVNPTVALLGDAPLPKLGTVAVSFG